MKNIIFSIINAIYIVILNLPIYHDTAWIPEMTIDENGNEVFDVVRKSFTISPFERLSDRPLVFIAVMGSILISIASGILCVFLKKNKGIQKFSKIIFIISTVLFVAGMIIAAAQTREY